MKSVIVDADTLRAIGLRAMLERFGGLEPIITTDPTTLCPLDDSTLFLSHLRHLPLCRCFTFLAGSKLF